MPERDDAEREVSINAEINTISMNYEEIEHRVLQQVSSGSVFGGESTPRSLSEFYSEYMNIFSSREEVVPTYPNMGKSLKINRRNRLGNNRPKDMKQRHLDKCMIFAEMYGGGGLQHYTLRESLPQFIGQPSTEAVRNDIEDAISIALNNVRNT
jgi:hypothetical protein